MHYAMYAIILGLIFLAMVVWGIARWLRGERKIGPTIYPRRHTAEQDAEKINELMRRRASGEDWTIGFLEALADSGFLQDACRIADVSRQMVFDRRQHDPDFNVAYKKAKDNGLEQMESELMRRAKDSPILKQYLKRYNHPVYALLLTSMLLAGTAIGCAQLQSAASSISTSLGIGQQPVPPKTLAQIGTAYAAVVQAINVEYHAGRFSPATFRRIQADAHAFREAYDAASADAANGATTSQATIDAIAKLADAVTADRAAAPAPLPAAVPTSGPAVPDIAQP